MSQEFPGYRGEVLRVLRKAGADIGDIVRIIKDGVTYEGILFPRSEYGDTEHVVLKLKSGYNIGIHVTPTTEIRMERSGVKPTFISPPSPKQKKALPKVAILSTGGTIASRVDYRTGGVRPALSASDLYSVVPELSEIASIDAEILFSLFSENITPEHWSVIAQSIVRQVTRGVAGVVIAHGTDTLAHTAAALSFALQNLPVPIILVGSQRSADRPSSDAAFNLAGAVAAAARAPFAEVVLAMHDTVSDRSLAFHRGTKVRKCHTSRRDAFKSINAPPIARMVKRQIMMQTESYNRRESTRKISLQKDFVKEVALVKVYPGLNPQIFEWYVNQGYRGIVLEGTGLGHISKHCFAAVKRAIESNIVVAMTSQCIWGRVNMNVYDTGRDLLEIGVVPLGDMLPETALVKLMWILGSLKPKDSRETRHLLLTNFAGEINPRSTFSDQS